MLELFLSAFQNLRANKLRSMLTMLGIIIGISSVITIVSLGQGAKMQVMGEFDKMGQNVINIEKKSTGMMGGMVSFGASGDTIFSREDGEMLQKKFPEITDIIMYTTNVGTAKYDKKDKMVMGLAVSSAYPVLAGTDMLTGRFFSESEDNSAKPVAVIDKIAANKLFNSPNNALGKKIQLTIGKTTSTFTIIGVAPAEGGDLMSSFEDQMPGSVYIPLTLSSRCLETEAISQISIMLNNMDNAKELGSKIVRVLEKAHKVDDAYIAKEGFQQVAMLDSVLTTLTMAIGAIAAISLLVGGIGVMNIMLVSVTERTREIGIRKALGATRKNIKMQFLLESVILCLIGGIIGITFGISFGMLAGMLIGVKAELSLGIVILAFAFSTAVGIFFGLYPSNKAAKLDPIEALRYE